MPKRKISSVWSFFTRNNKQNLAKCNICKKEYKTSGNTSNLLDHLKRCHESRLVEDETVDDITHDTTSSTSAKTIGLYFTKENVYAQDSSTKKKLDRALINMISVDYQPFSIVQDKGFKDFIKVIDPRYQLPSKSTLRDKLLKQYYEEIKVKMFNMLKDVEFVSLTCDLWSSRSNESYLTLTCHFIDCYFNLRCAVLSTNAILNNHTAENIASEITIILKEWNLENKVACIVTDNATSMTKACKILKIRHHPCFAHTMNLLVQDALKNEEVQSVLVKCKELVKFFKSSNIATEKLKNEQVSQNKVPLKLVQEVPTRWNSGLFMMKRILQINDAITITLSKIRKAPMPLTLEEVMILEDMVSILSIFDEATKKISGNYVTISLIIPIVCGIYNNCITYKPNTPQGHILLKSIFDGMCVRLFPYEERTLSRIATILDPRTKKIAFRSSENANAAVSLLQSELAYCEVASPENTGSQPNNQNEKDPSTSSSSITLFNFMTERIAENNKTRTNTVDSIIILRQYLERPNIDIEMDPLLFWKVNGTEFQNLQLCAKKFLSTPATSVPSERIFSKTGLIVSDRRSRIKPKNVDMLIFINHNNWINEILF